MTMTERRVTKTVPSFLGLIFALLAVTGANAQEDAGGVLIGTPYQSTWAKLYPDTLIPKTTPDGTPIKLSPVFEEFYAAAASKRLRFGKRRWQQFLTKYAAAEDEFEDAVTERFWKWADLEIKRCDALLANETEKAAGLEEKLKEMGESITD